MSSRAALWSVVCGLLLAGCGAKPASRGPSRIAFLPLDNQSSDAGNNWIGRAAAGVVAYQLNSGPSSEVIDVPDARTAAELQATEEVVGFFDVNKGRLELSAYLRDPGSQRTIRTLHASSNVNEPFRAFAELAKQINSTAKPKPFPTQDVESLKAFFQASIASDPAEQESLLAKAVAEDPDFTLAQFARIRSALVRGDQETAMKALDQARANIASFRTDEDRAKLDYLASEVTGDKRTRLAALLKLSKAEPHNVEYWNQYAVTAMSLAHYARASSAYEKLTQLEPQQKAHWNNLGYARVYSGDLSGAVSALEQYRKLAPTEANPVDSLGEVHFYAGKFREAASFFLEAHKLQPQMLQGGHLFRAAYSQFLSGAIGEADVTFARYIAYRKQGRDPLLELRSAIWLAMTGRRKEALAKLGSGPLAAGQRCLWLLDAGNRTEAKQALTSGVSPQDLSARFCEAFLQPISSLEGWQGLFAKGVPNQALRNELAGFAMALTGHEAEGVSNWSSLLEGKTPDASTEPRIMQASALRAAGKGAEAPKVLPPRSPDPGFASLVWSRYLKLRSAAGAE
ncbi:MAG TPA: hypothetical protein VE621_24380 [Bryobacteraceae bacterium]|nr:hypothetical protein [Bryobacteraceae bacterium]